MLLVIVACAAGIGVALWLLLRRRAGKARESEARAALMLAEATRALAGKAARKPGNVTGPDKAARD